MERRRRLNVLEASALAALLAAGCAATPPAQAPTAPTPEPPASAPAPAKEDPNKLPPSLEALDLTAEQRAELVALSADLKRDLAPLNKAVRELAGSIAGAARHCKGDSPFIEADAAYVVRAGDQARDVVLDAVQRLHRILTREQRQKLAKRLLDDADATERARRDDRRTRSISAPLDLSLTQTLAMLVRIRRLWSAYEDRIEPWRVRYLNAVAHFARDEFDVRKEPAAEAPIFALGASIVRDGVRTLVPLLEPPQCEALGRLIDESVEQAR